MFLVQISQAVTVGSGFVVVKVKGVDVIIKPVLVVSLYFAVAYCCMQKCELSYWLLGVWKLALYCKGVNVNVELVSHWCN